jgi:hypothetical protein
MIWLGVFARFQKNSAQAASTRIRRARPLPFVEGTYSLAVGSLVCRVRRQRRCREVGAGLHCIGSRGGL